MLRRCLVAAALVVGPFSVFAQAPSHSVIKNRQVTGEAGKPIRIGIYTHLNNDCSTGPLPSIRLTVRPSHGEVTVQKGQAQVSNHATCLAVEVPAFVAYYKSQPGYSGTDALQIEAKDGGAVVLTDIVVTVQSDAIKL